MWLLNTSTLHLEEFFGTNVPFYAILSHTWTNEEVSLHELQNLNEAIVQKAGFKKIMSFCELAKRENYSHAWVDACCIDKRSSAELTEAINSMYKWYCNASICMVYLVDVPGPQQFDGNGFNASIEAFKKSRWFSRGWTLQELIACSRRRFYASDWSIINQQGYDLADLISNITHIDIEVLHDHRKLHKYCTAERMSWAARRETTRPEDIAYSLMGIFGVNMPVLYGEGLRAAFRRLQNEIMNNSFDQTLFAWRGPYKSSGLLAYSPTDFADTPKLGLWRPNMLSPFSMTNAGIYFQPCLFKGSFDVPRRYGVTHAGLQCDIMTQSGWMILFIRLKAIQIGTCRVNNNNCTAYRRIDCDTWDAISGTNLSKRGNSLYQNLLVLEDEHFDLMVTSIDDDDSRDGKRYDGDQIQTFTIGDS
jgi:hypothetical protein